MRRVALILLAGFALAAGAGVTTSAFSSQASNSGNSFQAAASFSGGSIAQVKTVGSAVCTASPTTITVPAGGVAAGNTLIVRIALRGSGTAGTVQVTDSRSNTYAIDFDYTGFNASLRHVILSANVATALAANDTITVTHPNSSARAVAIDEFSGIAATDRVDITARADGSSATPSVIVTTPTANDLLYGVVGNAANVTYTEAAAWTPLTHLAMNCGGGPSPKGDSHAAYRIVSGTGTFTYDPTLSAGNGWTAAIVAYKPAGSPGPRHSLDLNGDGRDDVAGLTAAGAVSYTTNLSTWTQIAGARTSLAIGDFDGNGRDDVVALDASNQVWYTTDLSTWTQIPGARTSVATGDFDGNGRDDVAALDASNQVWYTTDLATWTQIPGTRTSLAVGDFDGNGREELAARDASNQVWYTTDLATWTQIAGARTWLTVGDFDGNGRDDLAALDASEALWYTTNLSTWTSIPGAAVWLIAGDFDVNGRDDLAALNSAQQLWYSTDLVNWTQIPGAAVELVPLDLDGNGRDDLVGRNTANEIWYSPDLSNWTQFGTLTKLGLRP